MLLLVWLGFQRRTQSPEDRRKGHGSDPVLAVQRTDSQMPHLGDMIRILNWEETVPQEDRVVKAGFNTL